MKHAKLIITLKSDLCVSSGYAYAGIIDQDVCYDDYGIPYIPARRLKGCLKEAAELIHAVVSPEKVHVIFGESRKGINKGIMIENAYIEGYKDLVKAIEKLKSVDDIGNDIAPQRILERYTAVRGQTALQNGVADENSLRYIRTVNHFSPGTDGKELTFEAGLYYDESYKEELEFIIKALHYIGSDRNRGLGSVRCSLINTDGNDSFKNTWQNGTMAVELINEEPLMISASNNVSSLTYIPGKNLLGALAAEYLKDCAKSADDEEFRRLFLDGTVTYSNLYISENGMRTIPAPDFIRRLKKSEKYVNTLQYNPGEKYESDYSWAEGNRPKKLRGKYVCIDSDNLLHTSSVKTDVVYHHRKNVKEEDRLLYAQTAVKAGQAFKGVIQGPQEDLEVINALLSQTTLRFGKSKTAQYGRCRIACVSGMDKVSPRTFEAGDILLVSLASDLVLVGDCGYIVRFDEVYKETARQLGIEGKYESLDEETMSIGDWNGLPLYSTADSVEIHGYQNKWNMRKAPIPAVSAGSTFVYRLTEECTLKEGMIGEYTHEGYGEIRLFRLSDMPYRLSVYDKTNKVKTSADKFNWADYKPSEEAKRIICSCIFESLKEKIRIALQNDRKAYVVLDPSKLGRVTLMLKESLASSSVPNDQFSDLCKRISSIKSVKDKETAERIVRNYIGKDTIEVERILNIHNSSLKGSPEFIALTGLKGETETMSMIEKIWGEILMEYLTILKYGKKA